MYGLTQKACKDNLTTLSAEKEHRPRKRQSGRCDKHLDHMTLTTVLPLHVSIDICHTETHTKHSSHTKAFWTLCKKFSTLYETKVFLCPFSKTDITIMPQATCWCEYILCELCCSPHLSLTFTFSFHFILFFRIDKHLGPTSTPIFGSD